MFPWKHQVLNLGLFFDLLDGQVMPVAKSSFAQLQGVAQLHPSQQEADLTSVLHAVVTSGLPQGTRSQPAFEQCLPGSWGRMLQPHCGGKLGGVEEYMKGAWLLFPAPANMLLTARRQDLVLPLAPACPQRSSAEILVAIQNEAFWVAGHGLWDVPSQDKRLGPALLTSIITTYN